jgi:hypothetical protein
MASTTSGGDRSLERPVGRRERQRSTGLVRPRASAPARRSHPEQRRRRRQLEEVRLGEVLSLDERLDFRDEHRLDMTERDRYRGTGTSVPAPVDPSAAITIDQCPARTSAAPSIASTCSARAITAAHRQAGPWRSAARK